jgi:hypothetical protein
VSYRLTFLRFSFDFPLAAFFQSLFLQIEQKRGQTTLTCAGLTFVSSTSKPRGVACHLPFVLRRLEYLVEILAEQLRLGQHFGLWCAEGRSIPPHGRI